MKQKKITSYIKLGKWGAIIAFLGTLFSGPIAMGLVYLVQPQPEWKSVSVYVSNFHPVQTVPFYFGFLLLGGSITMMASIFLISKDKGKPLLGLIFTTIGCAMIFFNYFLQNTVVPALVWNYVPENGPILAFLTMSNPLSFSWAVEMWGYGFLGVGTWFAASFFSISKLEKTAKILYIVNGILSVAGALVTAYDLRWVLNIPGLISYGLWNILYVVLIIYFYKVLIQRERNLKSK